MVKRFYPETNELPITKSVSGLTAARLPVLSLCAIRLLYGSGNDSVDRKAKSL